MTQFRTRNGIEQIRVSYSPDKWQSWDSFVKDVENNTGSWEDREVDCGTESDYNGEVAYLRIEGWRAASDEDLQRAQHERLTAEQLQREWQERQVAELREQRPDLFT